MQAHLSPPGYIIKSFSYTFLTMVIMVCALFLSGRWYGAAAIALGLFFCAASIARSTRVIRTTLKRHPASHRFSPNLGRIVSELCAAAGLPPNGITLVDFNAAEDAVKDMNDKKKKFTPRYVLNAAAAYGADDVIMVSEPLLQLLEDDEEKGILGHELAHHLLRHTVVGACRAYIGTITSFACFAIATQGALASGWRGILAGILAMCAASLLFRMVHPDGRQIGVRQKPDMSAYDLILNDRVKAAHQRLISLSFAAGVTYFNHLYPAIYLTAWLLLQARAICANASTHSQEFGADEGACRLKASPLALATGLRKMKILEERSKEKAMQKTVILPRPPLFRGLRRALYATHPSTPRRVERLCAIARQQGLPEAAIRQAEQGELVLPADCEIPYDVIKHYLRQL